MNEKIIKVNVASLFLNTDNPRFDDKAENQRDAIIKIVQEQKDKIVALANDIVEFGLNSMEKVAVIKNDSNTFIVKEGNRRVAAIKLLTQPNLIEVENKIVYEKFKQLTKRFMDAPITTLDCALYEDENTLNKFIELKHTGENGGIGVAAWDTIQKRKFEESLGKHSMVMKAINFIRGCENIDEEIKSNIHRMAITNFERLLGDPYVRNELSISCFKNGPFVIELNNSKTFALFNYILRDLIFNEDFNVKQIYYRDDRRNYIEEAKKVLDSNSDVIKIINEDLEDNRNSAINTGDLKKSADIPVVPNQRIYGQALETQSRNPSTQQRRNPLPTNRKTLIPNAFKIKIKHPRLNKIYHELCKLEIAEYTNACAVLFRTFIELSVDVYAKNKKIQGYTPEMQLHQKITNVSQYLQNNHIMTTKELKPIELLSSTPKGVTSINTFNSYVHNSEMIPIADNLKNSWDSISNFIEKIFE